MPKIRRSIDVELPAEELFALAQDYALRPEWDPLHDDHRFLDGTTQGPGARLWYRAKYGMTMTVRYVSYEPPHRVAMAMVSGPRLLERFAGSWTFERRGPTRTRAVFQYHFALRFGWLGRLLGGAVAAALGHNVAARLEGLKRFAEGRQPPS